MIRDERWKLIWYPQLSRHQLFDLTTDPDELHDLSTAPQHAAQVATLQQQLTTWLQKNGDPLFDAR